MRILYSLSVILLILCFLLAKKDDKKLNILKWVLISIVVFSGFNAFSAFLVSIVHIKASLFSRFIINLIASVAIWHYSLRNKAFQKYYFKWTDVIALVVITIACSIVVGIRTHGFDLYFETTDPASHVLNAERFVDTERIAADNDIQDVLYNTKKTYDLFYASVNLGTMIQVFETTKSSHVIIFYTFEYLTMIFSVFAFYLTIAEKSKENLKCIICFVISMIYMLGYPLNNFIFGFHYLGLAVFISNMIIMIYEEMFENEKYSNILVLVSALILNFSLFTSYYLFIPIVYGGIGIYVLWKTFINHQIGFKIALKIILTTLVIPFMLGIYLYFIYPKIIFPNELSTVSAFKLNGYIYRNLIGNFLILFPIVIYYFISCVKNKKIEAETFMLPILVIFMLYILKLMYKGEAETYYYYKFYFMLSLLTYLSIGKLFSKDKKFDGLIGSYVIVYGLLIVAMFFNIDGLLYDKYVLINPVPSIDNVVHVYKTNKNYIYDASPIYTKNQLNSLDKIYDLRLLKSGNVYYFGDLFQKLWIYSLYRISPVLDEYRLGAYYDENPSLNEVVMDNEDVKYILVKKSDKINNQILKFNNSSKDKYLEMEYKDKNFILYKITIKQ